MNAQFSQAIFTSSLAIAISSALLPFASTAEAMSAYRWKKRPLVVFAPSAGNPALARQRAIVNASAGGFRSRDMVVVYVIGGRVSAAFGGGPGLSAAALRQRYGVNAGQFRVVLVGKDGGSKLRSAQPISARRLFGVIDAMPMRQQEMRRRER